MTTTEQLIANVTERLDNWDRVTDGVDADGFPIPRGEWPIMAADAGDDLADHIRRLIGHLTVVHAEDCDLDEDCSCEVSNG